MKSRNDDQLKDPNSQSVSDCKPEDTVNGSVIVPCGLIAWSLFNDTYSFSRNNQQVAVNKKGISWKSDRNHKFGKDVFPKNFQNGTLIGGAHLNASIPVSFFITLSLVFQIWFKIYSLLCALLIIPALYWPCGG